VVTGGCGGGGGGRRMYGYWIGMRIHFLRIQR